jgi:hypothetical protein
MRKKWLKLAVMKTPVCLTVDRREREVKNTAGTVNGEGESQESSNIASILLSIGANMKAGSI